MLILLTWLIGRTKERVRTELAAADELLSETLVETAVCIMVNFVKPREKGKGHERNWPEQKRSFRTPSSKLQPVERLASKQIFIQNQKEDSRGHESTRTVLVGTQSGT